MVSLESGRAVKTSQNAQIARATILRHAVDRLNETLRPSPYHRHETVQSQLQTIIEVAIDLEESSRESEVRAPEKQDAPNG